MSYLKNNNNKVVVDAVLTKAGQAKLAASGMLDIKSFRLSDDEIDYGLYNYGHPQGTDYFDSAIVNMPTTEASVDTGMVMQFNLFTPNTPQPIRVPQMVLTFPLVMTGSGVSDYNPRTITPSIYPDPKLGRSEIPNSWFRAQVYNTATVNGAVITFTGTRKTGIPIIPRYTDSVNYYKSKETAQIKYALGDYISFTVNRFPTIASAIRLLVWNDSPYVMVSPQMIYIKLKSRAEVGDPPYVEDPTEK